MKKKTNLRILIDNFLLSIITITAAVVLVWLVGDRQNVTLAYTIVVFWTFGTAWACVATALTLSDSLTERRTASDDPVLQRIALGNIRREIFRLVELFCLCVVGALILDGITSTLVMRSLILTVTVLLVANSILDRIERRETDQMIRAALIATREKLRGHLHAQT